MNYNWALVEFKLDLQRKGRSPGTIEEYEKDLKSIERFFKERYGSDLKVSDITNQDLNSYLDHLIIEKQYKPSSRNRQMNTMRSFWKYCKKINAVQNNPAEYLERIEEDVRTVTFLSVNEVQALLTAIQHPLVKLVVCTLFFTGLRISECLQLKVEDIDLENNQVKVRKGKGNKSRTVPLHPELKQLIEDYMVRWRVKGITSLLFLTERTGKLSDVYVNKVLKETVQRLGWDKKVTCHVLRHSFASALVENNVNLVAVKELLGHANIKTTSSYTHVHEQSVTEAVHTLSI